MRSCYILALYYQKMFLKIDLHASELMTYIHVLGRQLPKLLIHISMVVWNSNGICKNQRAISNLGPVGLDNTSTLDENQGFSLHECIKGCVTMLFGYISKTTINKLWKIFLCIEFSFTKMTRVKFGFRIQFSNLKH